MRITTPMRAAFLVAALGTVVAAMDDAPRGPKQKTTLRRPVAAVLADGGRLLCVANRDGGTISLIETATYAVRTEVRVGGRLTDLAAVAPQLLVATDAEANAAVLLRIRDDGVEPLHSVNVGRAPLRLAVSPAGGTIAVAALWSHEVFLLRVEGAADSDARESRLTVKRSVSLPFAPRAVEWLPDGRHLIVAAAFGGEVAAVDGTNGAVASVRDTQAHNIRDILVVPELARVFLTHQVLDESQPTQRDVILNGRLVRNQVTAFRIETVLDPQAMLAINRPSLTLGVDNWPQGGGDPSGLAFDDSGRLVVTAAGIDQIVIYDTDGFRAQRVDVGRHPTAVVGLGGGRVIVINTFDDSLSLVDTEAARVVREIALGAKRELMPAERGEELFYDARLSQRGWMSCHSCHTDGHTNDRLADTFGDDSYGTPKRVLSLLGSGQTDPWAWNGLAKELHGQVERSVRQTMHGERLTGGMMNDIVAYLHTLPPAPPVSPPKDDADQAAIERGRGVFTARSCVTCHIPPLTYTSHGAYDVGMPDEAGLRKFNPPSLRGVSQRRRLFHDGRTRSLEAVFTEQGHQLEDALSDDELRDLLRFLRSL